MTTLYTAIGRFHKKGNMNGLSCPVIFIGQQEYMMDLQEMMVWTILSWSILEVTEIEQCYKAKTTELGYHTQRSLADCIRRLKQRGLIVTGTGSTGEDALYNLVSCLYVIPLSNSLLVKSLTLIKLTLSNQFSIPTVQKIWKHTPLSACEKKVIKLSNQALLSTAEIMKCIEQNNWDLSSHEKILDALYGDEETTSDNISSIARCFQSQQPVLLAIANLYLHQCIIFERGDVA